MAKKVNYLSNKNILEMIDRWHKTGDRDKIPDELAKVAILICDRLLTSPNWRGYDPSVKAEMKSQALFLFTKYFKSFDPKKSQNPFSYITTIAMNAFRQVVNKEYEEQGKAVNYYTANTDNIEHEDYYTHLVETQLDPIEKKKEKRKSKSTYVKKNRAYNLFGEE